MKTCSRELLTMSCFCLTLSRLALGATLAQGVSAPVARGFFAETDIGGLLTLGGNVSDDGGRQYGGYSNLQPYLQLGIGYGLEVFGGKGLIPVGIHLGLGANAQNCFAGLSGAGRAVACQSSDSFTLTFLSATAGYLFRVAPRLFLGAKGVLGLTLLDPSPVAPLTQPTAGSAWSFNAGAAVSLEYATRLEHFSVGFDLVGQTIFGSTIFVLQMVPRIQYTF